MSYVGATENELCWSYREWVILELQRMSYFRATENELF
jgi:hypothetical protein